MRRRELEHFYIGNSYGGNQGWFRSFMMRIGGCGAETACDSSLYFALNLGIEGIYPFDVHRLSKRDYVDFAHIMEKYLWPRMSGIDRTEIFVDGYAKYLRDRGVDSVSMTTLEGTEPYESAAEAVMRQIDAGYPVPTLILNHRDRKYADYNWHWFLINGYEVSDDQSTVLVKAVTYSSYEWLDLRRLWDTGHIRRGGLVLFSADSRPAAAE
ncbi:MAG: hypothetical protein J6D57_11680 [Mogibacterium sp.]|nr:hypothetical protein [Mogibacterium sp.]